MISKTLTVTLLCVVALCAPMPGAAQDPRAAREAMAEMMVRMMEAMGLFGGGSLGSWGGVPAISGLSPPWGSYWGVPGASGWGAPVQDPSKAMGMGTDIMRQMSQGFPGAALGGAGALDGVWEGSAGDLLIVQGGRYRLYAPQDQYLDGVIQRQASRVALYNAKNGQTQIFDFATDDGRLALRDTGGQVYLYRRFGGTPAGSGVPPATPVPPSSSPPAATQEPPTPKSSGTH